MRIPCVSNSFAAACAFPVSGSGAGTSRLLCTEAMLSWSWSWSWSWSDGNASDARSQMVSHGPAASICTQFSSKVVTCRASLLSATKLRSVSSGFRNWAPGNSRSCSERAATLSMTACSPATRTAGSRIRLIRAVCVRARARTCVCVPKSHKMLWARSLAFQRAVWVGLGHL